MEHSENPVMVLSEDDSWELVAGVSMGRLVTRVGDVVDVVPINFVVDGGTLVFRTAPGAKLAGLTVNHSVVFEVDSFDEVGGWSVVLRGTAHALETEAEVAAAEALPLRPWVPTLKTVFVRIDVESVSGRQFRFGEEPRREDVQEG